MIVCVDLIDKVVLLAFSSNRLKTRMEDSLETFVGYSPYYECVLPLIWTHNNLNPSF